VGFESGRFNSAAAATFVSTLALFVGMLGASSNLRVFTILALLGSSWLAFEVGYYDTSLLRYSTGTPGKAIACLVVLFVCRKHRRDILSPQAQTASTKRGNTMATMTAPVTDTKRIPGGSFLITDPTAADCFLFPKTSPKSSGKLPRPQRTSPSTRSWPASDQIEAKDFAVTKRLLKEAAGLGLTAIDIPRGVRRPRDG